LEVSIDLSGIVFIAALLLGPALIGGGVVLYRQAAAVGWRAVGMSAIAAGVALLLMLALFLPATSTTSGASMSMEAGPVVHTESR
jgi:hypothetical protein